MAPGISMTRQDYDECLYSSDLPFEALPVSAEIRPLGAVERAALLPRAQEAIRRRHVQRSIFPAAVFRESCWDIMLLCFASQLEGRQLCIKQIRNQLDESSTALLRRVDELEDAGLLQRRRDEQDGRRTMVGLTPFGNSAMARFFERVKPITA